MFVTLRPWTCADATDLLAAHEADPGLTGQFGSNRPRTLDDFTQFIADEMLVTAGQEVSLAIDLGGRAIGYVGVACAPASAPEAAAAVTPEDADRPAWVHYWLTPEHRGAGLASRACASLVRFAFDQMGVTRVELGHRADNEASCRVAHRSGFDRVAAHPVTPRNATESFAMESHTRLANDPLPDLLPIPIVW